MCRNNSKFYAWCLNIFSFPVNGISRPQKKNIKHRILTCFYTLMLKIECEFGQELGKLLDYKIISIFFWNTLYISSDINFFFKHPLYINHCGHDFFFFLHGQEIRFFFMLIADLSYHKISAVALKFILFDIDYNLFNKNFINKIKMTCHTLQSFWIS